MCRGSLPCLWMLLSTRRRHRVEYCGSTGLSASPIPSSILATSVTLLETSTATSSHVGCGTSPRHVSNTSATETLYLAWLLWWPTATTLDGSKLCPSSSTPSPSSTAVVSPETTSESPTLSLLLLLRLLPLVPIGLFLIGHGQ